MNGAHFHLALNHFPVVGIIIAILVIGFGLWKHNTQVLRTGLAITLFTGVMGVGTFLTGEEAEEVLEGRPGFEESFVEEHEDAALFALISVGLSAVTAAAGLYFSLKKSRIPKALVIAIVIVHLWALSVVARTNYLGGLISHPELRE